MDDMNTWKLKRTEQCEKCPWKVSTDPTKIPRGYSKEKHAKLSCTIAREADFSFLIRHAQHVMACHEEHEAHCIGWLINQLGSGNNIGLRLSVRSCENIQDVKTHGKQHEIFEDTLPWTIS